MLIIEVAGYLAVYLLSGKQGFGIDIVFDTKQVGACRHQRTHILGALVTAHEIGLVISKRVFFQPGNFFTFGSGIAVNHTLVGHL